MWETIAGLYESVRTLISPVLLLDLAIIGLLFYRVLLLIRGTRAVQLLKGLAVLVIASVISQWVGLQLTSWLLSQVMTVGLVALPIIFYPELRRALEQLGRGRLFPKASLLPPQERAQAISHLVRAVVNLAERRVGALIIWEQETGLKDWSESGVAVDAQLTSELLINIFEPNTPLHDGAVILRANRVRAASCYLPLTDNPEVNIELGSRHRAALGITEQSDAVAIVVSEETGAISMAVEGTLTRYLDEKNLKQRLETFLQTRQQEHSLFSRRWQPGWKE
ncbi:MAG: TIGR00159 family protein [Firmicutes bacterium]|nr:TIGR00159 family protein [Bacillota bacterium]